MSPPADVGRFRLLASALAGRSIEVTEAAAGSPTWNDGRTIHLDERLPADQWAAAVAIQAVLVGAGSLVAEIVAVLRRRSGLADRYLAVEAHRALASYDGALPPAVRQLIDPRVASQSGSPHESLELAASGRPVELLPSVFGAIRPRDIARAAADGSVGGSDVHRPRSQPARALADFSDDERPEDAGSAFDVSSPVGGGGAIGRLLRRMLRDTRAGGAGPPGADAPTHRLRVGSGGSGRRAISTGRPVVIDDRSPLASPAACRYPEWDLHRRTYRPQWCTVTEVAPADGGSHPLAAPNTHWLRLPLTKVVLDFDRRRRQLQGDELDLDAIVDSAVERAGGGRPSEAVYVDTLRRRRDLAVLVLLDVSGSAREPGVGGRSVHEHQRATAAALTFAFNDLGDRVALYGFRSVGRSDVQLLPLKRFEDRAGGAVLERLGDLEPGAYTRLGAAIRHAAHVLQARGGARRRLLVVLSDGFAYDHGYDGEYGEADARRALFEARRRGVGCLCLSVGTTTDVAALARVFGTASYAVVPNPAELGGIARRLFVSALKSAEEQRRSA